MVDLNQRCLRWKSWGLVGHFCVEINKLTDETLKKIAHELTENLRQNLSVDWSERESVRAKLRLMVKRILRKYKYPPDLQEEAVDLVLRQAQVFGDNWGGA